LQDGEEDEGDEADAEVEEDSMIEENNREEPLKSVMKPSMSENPLKKEDM